jgi:hypothetical protein
MTEVNKSTARGWPLSYDRRLKSLRTDRQFEPTIAPNALVRADKVIR